MGKNKSASNLVNVIDFNNDRIAFISGSTTLMSISSSGAITVTGVISGSNAASASYALNAGLLNNKNSAEFTSTGSFNAYTSSNDATVTSVAGAAVSAVAGVNALAARTSSYTTTSSFNSYTASNNTTMSCVSSTATSALVGVGALASQTGSYATTGSNTFVGGQYLSSSFNPTGFSTTASLYTDGGLRVTRDAYISGTLYLNNVTVYGTQSVCFITSSQLNISSNIINVNTATPSVRFGGLSVYDSGSTGLTGSMLWDSQDNQWIYSNPSGSTYDSAMFLVGPRNTGTLGGEVGIECNFLSKGNGMHHMTSSAIFENGTTTCFYGNSFISSSGAACFACQVCAPIVVGSTSICSPQIYATTSATVFGSTYIQPTAVSNNVGLYIQNNSTGGYGSSLALGLYGYNTSNYFNPLRIETSYPGYGLINFYVKSQSNSSEVAALQLDGTGVATFSSCVIANGGVRTTGANGFSDTDGTSTIWMSANWTSSRPAIAVTTNHPLMFLTNNTERVRISNTGVTCFACQVYIGTNKICWTDSTFKTLQVGNGAFNNINNQTQIVNNIYFDGTNYRSLVAGASNRFIMATDGNYFFEYATSPGEGCVISLCSRMFICGTNGNVGIGTIAPTFPLDVQRNTGAIIRALDTSTNSSLILQAGTGAGMKVTGYNYNTSTAVPLYISVDGANTIMQNGGGNVGIGNTSPSYQLDMCSGTTVNQRIRLQRGSDDTNQNMLIGWNNIVVTRHNVSISGNQTDFSIIQCGSDGARVPFNIGVGGHACFTCSMTIGTGCRAFGRNLTVQGDVVAYYSDQESVTMGISAGTGAQSWGIQVCDTGDGSSTLHLNARGGHVGINKGAGNAASYPLDVTGVIRATGNIIASCLSIGSIGHYNNYSSNSGCFAIFCASQGAILYVTSMHNGGRATYQLVYSNGATGGASISVNAQTSAYGPACTSFALCGNGWVYAYQPYGGPTDYYAISMNSNFAWGF